MKIESLYRYPVKGLTPEPLAEAALTPGRCIPWDRAFALAQGDSSLRRRKIPPGSKNPISCACCATPKSPRLATQFDEATRPAQHHHAGGRDAAASPVHRSRPGRAYRLSSSIISASEARYGADGKSRRASIISTNHSFCDHKTQVISLIGLGSLARAGGSRRGAARQTAVPRQYLHREHRPLGRIRLARQNSGHRRHVTLLVQERIDRCGATSVNPDTAVRDANPVKSCRRNFGHIELGVFAKVLTGGEIRVGDEIRVI